MVVDLFRALSIRTLQRGKSISLQERTLIVVCVHLLALSHLLVPTNSTAAKPALLYWSEFLFCVSQVFRWSSDSSWRCRHGWWRLLLKCIWKWIPVWKCDVSCEGQTHLAYLLLPYRCWLLQLYWIKAPRWVSFPLWLYRMHSASVSDSSIRDNCGCIKALNRIMRWGRITEWICVSKNNYGWTER